MLAPEFENTPYSRSLDEKKTHRFQTKITEFKVDPPPFFFF